ncbi:MAG: sigma-70 family RNA polymerase sigma factor [Clostridiales bacterium]|nr:sigma-70 family RNA polymerase sigma factor [Clostridiales bacterium]
MAQYENFNGLTMVFDEEGNEPYHQTGDPETNEVIEADIENDFDREYGQTYTPEEWIQIVTLYNGDDALARNEAGEKAYYALKPFIISIAKKLYGSYMSKYSEDLLSEGALGLCESLKTYDPSRAKPTTWCYRSIVHYMREFIDREVHHTTPHYQGNIKKIRDFITEREAMGESWTFDDLVVHTGISLTTILNCITIDKRNQNTVSIEQEVGDGSATILDFMPSNMPTPEEFVIKKEGTKQLCEDMRACLNERERTVLMMHYGFDDDIQKSAAEISRLTGIRKQDIRPILNLAEYKLRKYTNYKERYATEKRERSAVGREATLSMMKSKNMLVEELDSLIFEDDPDFI